MKSVKSRKKSQLV